MTTGHIVSKAINLSYNGTFSQTQVGSNPRGVQRLMMPYQTTSSFQCISITKPPVNTYHKAATYHTMVRVQLSTHYRLPVPQSGFIQLSGQNTKFNMVLTTYTNSTPISQDGYLPISGQGTNVNSIALANITPVQHGGFILFSG